MGKSSFFCLTENGTRFLPRKPHRSFLYRQFRSGTRRFHPYGRRILFLEICVKPKEFVSALFSISFIEFYGNFFLFVAALKRSQESVYFEQTKSMTSELSKSHAFLFRNISEISRFRNKLLYICFLYYIRLSSDIKVPRGRMPRSRRRHPRWTSRGPRTASCGRGCPCLR